MDAQTLILALQLGQGIIGFHSALEGVGHAAEFVVVIRHAVQRQLHAEELEAGFQERLLYGFDGTAGE